MFGAKNFQICIKFEYNKSKNSVWYLEQMTRIRSPIGNVAPAFKIFVSQ